MMRYIIIFSCLLLSSCQEKNKSAALQKEIEHISQSLPSIISHTNDFQDLFKFQSENLQPLESITYSSDLKLLGTICQSQTCTAIVSFEKQEFILNTGANIMQQYFVKEIHPNVIVFINNNKTVRVEE